MDGVLTQPDGSLIEARTWGDERASGYETLDGFTVVRAADGFWEFAALSDGQLVPSGVRVANGAAVPEGIRPQLRPQADAAASSESSGGAASAAFPGRFTGRSPTLVLLVDFADRPSVGTSVAQWNQRFFGATDSLRHFYSQASYGALALVPATETHGIVGDGVVGWLRMPYSHPDNRATGGVMENVVRDAVIAADRYVDFAAYDTNADGRVAARELHVAVVIAGYETAYGGAEWACAPNTGGHKGAVYDVPTVDGREVAGSVPGDIGGYTLIGEFHCNTSESPGHQASLGILAHEFGHDLGWPDLYDTGVGGTEDPLDPSHGVGAWSLMGGGMWNTRPGGFSGSTPALPDPFLKSYHGWVTPRLVEGAAVNVPVDAASTTPSVTQVLVNPDGVEWTYAEWSGIGEYFLIENRQLTGYDAGLPGCGVLIWHIDESVVPWWSANAVETHKLVDLEEADGRDDLDTTVNSGDAGDPYSGSAGRSEFSALTHPNSNLYSGAPSGVTVRVRSTACASRMLVDIAAPVSETCPPDDSYEPNDTRGSAVRVTSGAPVGGVVCNDDFFSIAARGGQTLTANLAFTHRAGGDLDMRLYDAAGVQLAASESRDDNERISFLVPTSGTYTIRVFGLQGSHNRYALTSVVDDLTAPTGSVSINAGQATAYGPSVALAIPASDPASGVVEMRLSNVGTMSGGILTAGQTRTYQASADWVLTDSRYGGTAATGPKTVYVQFRDRAGNWSPVLSDTISLVADAAATCAGATTARPLNAWQYDTIFRTGDVDWLRFDTTASQYALITLGRLPADYRLDLYNSSCALVASANSVGTTYEQIYRQLPAGRYFVRVMASGSAESPSAYGVRFQSLTEAVHLLSSTSWTDASGVVHIPGEVLNNTASNRDLVRVTATFIDRSGRVVGSTSATTYLTVVGTRTRSPFEVAFTPPAGYQYHRLSVTSRVTSAAVAGRNITAAQNAPYDDAAGRHYTGTLTNRNSSTRRDVRVLVTLYDAVGGVVNVGRSSPMTLLSGQSGSYSVVISPYARAIRPALVVQAVP